MTQSPLPITTLALASRGLAPGHYLIAGKPVYWTGRVPVGLLYAPPPPQPSADAERIQAAVLAPRPSPGRRAMGPAAGLLALVLATGCGGGDPEPDTPAEIPGPPCAASKACL